MIEKSIAAALEPIVDEVLKLERKMEDLELIEGPQGPAGKDAEPVDLEAIKKDVLNEINVDDMIKHMVAEQNEKAISEINAVFE